MTGRLSVLSRISNQLSAITKLIGGGERDRTDDLLVANQALSHLSYTPQVQFQVSGFWFFNSKLQTRNSQLFLVGLGRLELPTSRLSGVRSNQLSYRPSLRTSLGFKIMLNSGDNDLMGLTWE